MGNFPAKIAQFFSSGTGVIVQEPGDRIYVTTCFVWNCVRTLSEKYFPISLERMRSV